MPSLPPVFIEFLGSSAGVKTAMAEVKTEMAAADEAGAGAFAKTGMLGKAAIAGLGVAAFEVGKKTVEMAADFETQMTRVRTGAGEAAANMATVSKGVLAMAGEVGQKTEDLTSGLYMVESASYHGADALEVLKNSAEGAKVGAADLHTVTDAVTTAMNAYKMGAGQSAEATNALIATEAAGKTNLEDLAGSMASILPTAAAAHVGLNEVLGAMATMTAQGTPAAVAATYLRQTLGALSNPTGKASQEMKSLGLDSVQVSQNLGKNGLASTLTELTDAIQKKMGPAGTVLIEHLRAAAKDSNAYQKVLANLPPAQQTYIGALATMVGGTKSMQAALELTGPHMQDFQDNTKSITEHVKAGGKSIEGWKDVQGTLNQKLAEAKASAEAVGIQIGQYLMPAVKAIVGVVAEAAGWFAKHSGAAKVLAGVIGGVLVFALAALAAGLYTVAAAAAVNPVTWIILGVVALVAAIVELVIHWRSVWAEIQAIAKIVADAAVAAWHWVTSETARIWHDITSWVKNAWHDVAAFFEGAWHDVADPVVRTWDQLLLGAKAGWRAIVGAITDFWHSVTGFLARAWHDIEAPLVTAWNGIIGFFAKWWPLLLTIFLPQVASIISAWNHFHKQAWDMVVSVWNAISGFFVGVWHTIQDDADAAWQAIRRYIVKPVEEVWRWLVDVWNSVTNWLGGKWDETRLIATLAWAKIKSAIIDPIVEVWNWTTGMWNSLLKWLGDKFDKVWQTTMIIWAKIKSAIIDPIESAWHSVTSTGDKIGSSITGAFNTAKDKVMGIVHDFEDLGANIVKGIVSGISGAAHMVADKIKSLASGALDNAKSFLGINSPSKVFADHVGSAIPEGIAKGIADNSHYAHAAIGALSGSLAARPLAIPASFQAGGPYGAAAAAGGAPTTAQVTTIVQLDGKELLRAIQPHALRRDSQNSSPGLVLARA